MDCFSLDVREVGVPYEYNVLFMKHNLFACLHVSWIRPSGLFRIRINFCNYKSFQTFWWGFLDGGSPHRKACTCREKCGLNINASNQL